MRILIVAAAVVVVSCAGGSKPAGDAALSDVRATLGASGPVEHMTITLKRMPPTGQANLPYVQIGSSVMQQLRTVEWAELMDLDGDPTTTAQTTPTPGMTFSVDVPLDLKPSIKSKSGIDFRIIVNLFWGKADDTWLQQSRVEGSLESFYQDSYAKWIRDNGGTVPRQ